MLTYLAHAGESHATEAEASLHFLQEWYIALPLLILVTAGVAAISYVLTRKSKPVTYLVVAGFLLVAGVLGYTTSPIISIVSLATGMAMMLFIVLGSLAHKE